MIDSLRNRNIELQGEQLQLAELVDDDAEEESERLRSTVASPNFDFSLYVTVHVRSDYK